MKAGFRLARLEVLNWGTFGDAVWSLDARGDNTLLTGDIGSGKSTLVDAVTTLLVAPQRLQYNRAAGADARERNLRSYVLGYYKSERGDSGASARPVPLRDNNTYTVILARFANEGFEQVVTLAQVFWIKDDGPPDRFYVVSDRELSIAAHFKGFGTDINQLRKRLRKEGHEIDDSFARYCVAFRRRLGIENEQALDLFHQTVSMKQVGNLTDFVRTHMLQPFPVDERIAALIDHFNDLHRAHEAVLKARAQVEALVPLVDDCNKHARLSTEVTELRGCRDAIGPWFAMQKRALLERRLENLAEEIGRFDAQLETLREERDGLKLERDEIKRDIHENGGDRIETIKADISRLEADRGERQRRSERYAEAARRVGLPAAVDLETFTANQRAIRQSREETDRKRADAQNVASEATVELRALRQQHGELDAEVTSLRQRKSNIPARMLEMRATMCEALDLDEETLPFAGELLQVQPTEGAWEGAIERLLHGFGLSLLVPDAQYANVAQWVERTHLGGRLVYFRVRPQRAAERASLHADSLVHKLDVRPRSQFYGWLDAELARRFDYACCESLDQFRRETRAITKAGQTKGAGERHEKDDRHPIDDRSHFVLGWTNEAKIATLEKQLRDLEVRIQEKAERLATAQADERELRQRMEDLARLAGFEAFRGNRVAAARHADRFTEKRPKEAGERVRRPRHAGRTTRRGRFRAEPQRTNHVRNERSARHRAQQARRRHAAASRMRRDARGGARRRRPVLRTVDDPRWTAARRASAYCRVLRQTREGPARTRSRSHRCGGSQA